MPQDKHTSPSHSKETLLSDPEMIATTVHLVNLMNVKSSPKVAKQATQRSVAAITDFMRGHALFAEFLLCAMPHHVLRMRISRICRRYFHEKYIHKASITDVSKKELETLEKNYENLILNLKSLSPGSRVYIATSFYENDLKPYDFFSETENKLTSDLHLIRNLIRKRRGRGSPEITYVKNAAEATVPLFERCSGRRFKKNIHTTHRGGQEFIELDSLFVETLLKAIDPEITFANVRTALKAIPVD